LPQVDALDATATLAEQHRTVTLPGGALHLAWRESGWRLDDLCDFAARENTRRGFLIVSRVLGRHVPTRPDVMRASSDALAARLPGDFAGPVLFVGMAETAITLGQSVQEAYARETGRGDCSYIHSTRQRIGQSELLCFDEPHSHASAHLLYAPEALGGLAALADVRTLVLVDDEVSTGRTFVNLAQSLASYLPRLERLCVAVLTDWTGGDCFLSRLPVPASTHALLHGGYRWVGDPLDIKSAAASVPTNQLGHLDQRVNYGRLGLTAAPRALANFRQRLGSDLPHALHVIGTGELHYPAFLLAELLAAEGHDVLVQATTRSPARLGGAITARSNFADNYGTGVANYLYNLDQSAGRARIVCHETPLSTLDPALLAAPGTRTLDFGDVA
jgi:hypothetical protein